MINFRNIFNDNYSYIILIGICILFLLLALVLKNNTKFIKLFSKINLICSIITIIIALSIKLIVNNFNNYRIFIEIISDSVFTNLLYLSILNLFLFIIFYFIYRGLIKKES